MVLMQPERVAACCKTAPFARQVRVPGAPDVDGSHALQDNDDSKVVEQPCLVVWRGVSDPLQPTHVHKPQEGQKMKKVLLGTSALALAGAFASPAASAEWEVRVGGYMEQYVAFATSDFDDDRSGDWDGIDSKQDAEIFFAPSITLDNGIKIGANVQLEALQNGDQIDEAYMFIKGSFGEVLLGSENSAGYKMTYAAPDVTFVNVNSGSLGSFIPYSGGGAGSDIFRGTLGSTFLENGRNNDAHRFTYFTPRFSGFQVGVSYARDGNQDSNAQLDGDVGLRDIFDVGANYVNSFGDFDIALSGRWGTADDHDGSDATVWSAGLNLGFSGVTIGGSYAEQNNAGTMDGEVYDVGISYVTGPWGFSVTYMHGENMGNPEGAVAETHTGGGVFVPAVPATPEIGDEELDQFLVGISYSLAKGVKLSAFGAYVDFDDANGGTSDDSIDGFVIGTGIKISF
jgi:predicted porin